MALDLRSWRVGLVDLHRHDVVLTSCDEQKPGALVVVEGAVEVLMAPGEVGRDPASKEAAWRWDVVAFVDRPGLIL
jgi:hypothetical protein